MELSLPMIVVNRSVRQVEAWLPHFPGYLVSGPSLAGLRDELALHVMEELEKCTAKDLGRYQLAPHCTLRQVKIDTVAKDAKRGISYELKATMGIMLEKWPADSVWIATPTRLVEARFALTDPHDLEAVAPQVLASYCLKNRIPDLEACHAETKERLDILDVDIYVHSILPTAPRPRRRAKMQDAQSTEPAETPRDKETRRRMGRLQAVTLRAVANNLSHGVPDDTLERAFGRDALVRNLVDEFEGREGLAICLVGPSGVGKTAIIHEFTRRLYERYSTAGQRRDVWRMDGNRFISGMMYVGQWEERARKLMDELTETQDILYANDLLSLAFAGKCRKVSTNLSQFLEPALARGQINVLAECTPERFLKLREEAPTFASLFRVISVPDMTERETLPVLLGVLRDIETEHARGSPIRISPAALETVLQLSRRFMAHAAFPGKAVHLLKAVVGSHPSANESHIDVDDVLKTYQRQSGLPGFVLGLEKSRTRSQVSADLSIMVAGQPQAVEAVTDVIVSMQHALSDPDKPLATFLFVGPTGVGKTETAKALATYLFGSPSRMLRFDMSEFSTSTSVSRLVGHPDSPDGELTLALRTQPFCVVLFDEVEKAHPRVFDALLQLLGEGRLTDAAGRTADARQSVIIMTSNLGVREAASRTGFAVGDDSETRQHYMAAAQRFFRPEFFNRIDRVVPFGALGPEALRVVVEHALTDLLGRRGIQRGNVLVEADRELLDVLVRKAFDPRYGARPLKRALERRLTVPLAYHLVRRQSQDLSRVHLGRRGDDMEITVTTLRPPEPLTVNADPERWNTANIQRRYQDAQTILSNLASSDAISALKDTRAAALIQPATSVQHQTALLLLDELDRLRDMASLLARKELAPTAFEERPNLRHLRNWYRNPSHNPPPRPMPVFQEVPLAINLDTALKLARSTIADLWVSTLLLEHFIHAAARGQQDSFLMMVEPASSDVDHAVIDGVVHALPGAFCQQSWMRVEGRWIPHESGGRYLQWLGHFSMPGLRHLMQHLTGHALVELANGPMRRVLVRVVMLDGTGPEAVPAASHDHVEDEHTEARVGTLTYELKAGEPLRHVATGLNVTGEDNVLAAILCALKERG